MRTLRRAYEYLAMVIGLGSLALACLIWMPCAAVLHVILPPATGQRLGRWVIATVFRAYLVVLSVFCACRFDLSELDTLKRDRSVIVAANHPSLLDVVVLVSRLPHAVCVMKASILDNLLFGAAARLAGYIPNNGAMHLINQGRHSLNANAQLVLFPEGSRTKVFPLDPLGRTLGLVAKRAQAPVQTVLLEYSTPYLGKHWCWWHPPRLPLHCKARLGQRYQAPADHVDFTETLEQYFRAELAQPGL